MKTCKDVRPVHLAYCHLGKSRTVCGYAARSIATTKQRELVSCFRCLRIIRND
jgi:hypothetical protein